MAITGAQDSHVGDSPHDGQVLNALVGGAVLPHRQAAVGAHHLDIQSRIGHAVAHLLPSPASSKHGKGVHEGFLPAGSQACGHTNHVGLCNAHVKEPVRVGCSKIFGHGGARQVGIQDHQVGFLVGKLYQRLAIGGTGCNLFGHVTSPPFLPGWRPAPGGLVHTALHWGPCRASPPGSP